MKGSYQMKSKILIIAMAIAVVATVFMGCAKDNVNDTTTTGTSAVTDTSDRTDNDTLGSTSTTDTSDTTNEAESRADKVGDDIGNGVDDVADGVGGAVDEAGNAVKDALE